MLVAGTNGMGASNTIGKPRTQVLVVGAGPVGLLAALRLCEQGIQVRVIEQQTELRARTFPVVLHAQSLRVLGSLGLSPTLLWRGRAVSRMAVYTDFERRAVLELPKLRGELHGVVTLPQDVLRRALVSELLRYDVRIEWNTRLVMLEQDERAVWGRIIEHDGAYSPSGAVAKHGTSAFDADYVIGADGYESTVRDALGIGLVEYGPLTSFAFFDAVTDRAGREALLTFLDESCNSAFPLQDGACRFSFQLSRSLNRAPDESLLRELLTARLPWFAATVGRCHWSGVAEFRRALAEQFGRGRVWLAGESAHLTGPLGAQSLNVGLDEANELALRIADRLRHQAREPFGAEYDAERRTEWLELLGIEPRIAFSSRSPDWARRNLKRLIGCLPASGADLDDLLQQLRLAELASRSSSVDP